MPLTALILLPQVVVYAAAMRLIPLALAACLAFSPTALAEDPAPAEPAADIVRKSPAEMRADQLDRLFAKLHTASVADDTSKTEQGIWELWGLSDSPTAEVLLRQASRAMGDKANDAALKILNRLIGAHPDFPEAWNKRATLHFLVGRYDDSLKDIDKVLDLEPRHFGALAGRGMILERQKKYAAARAAFEDALAMNPGMDQVKQAVKALDRIERGI